jgi:phosphate-selective porin OprO/OprP
MPRIAAPIVLAAVAASLAFAPAARADDAGDVKKIVKDEIKAFMDKKKEEDTKGNVFKASWKDGLSLETPDKRFKVKIGGRLHLHNVIGDVPPEIETFDIPGPGGTIGEFEDTIFFRRARLFIEGEIYGHVKYKAQFDFAGGDADYKDVYIGLYDLKDCLGCWVPEILVGQFKEPFSLEENTSSNYSTMIERSLMNSVVPARNLGVMLTDHFWKDRTTFSVGFFATDEEDSGNDDETGVSEWEEGWALTARGTMVPFAKDMCHFVHVGAGFSHREVQAQRYRTRPDTGFGPRFVDTGSMDVEKIDLIGAELAVVWGSLSLQSEYTWVITDAPALDDPEFSSWYAMASWFLTGESRNYKLASGVFDKTKVCCNFLDNECCCFGALELTARYGTIDLTDGLVTGGELETMSVGLNWYLNTNTRVMFNFVHAIPDHPGLDEEADFFLTAVQVFF